MKRVIYQIVDWKNNLEMKRFIYLDVSSAQDFIESAPTICFCLLLPILAPAAPFPTQKFESCPARRASEKQTLFRVCFLLVEYRDSNWEGFGKPAFFWATARQAEVSRGGNIKTEVV